MMMLKAKHQRLVLAVSALVAVMAAGLIAAAALRKEASFFYTPQRFVQAQPAAGEELRLGGMVKIGSLQRGADGLTVKFIATDNKADVPVRYTGILPDLFGEGKGMVADGTVSRDGVFTATHILAKHDERYMPPQVAKEMAATDQTLAPEGAVPAPYGSTTAAKGQVAPR